MLRHAWWLGLGGLVFLSGCGGVTPPEQSEVRGYVQRSPERPPLKLVDVKITATKPTADNKQIEYLIENEYEVTEDILTAMNQKESQPLIGTMLNLLTEHDTKAAQIRFPELEELNKTGGVSRAPSLYKVLVPVGTRVKFDGALVADWKDDKGWRFSKLYVNWGAPYNQNNWATRGGIRGEFYVFDSVSSKASLNGYRQRIQTYIDKLTKIHEQLNTRLSTEETKLRELITPGAKWMVTSSNTKLDSYTVTALEPLPNSEAVPLLLQHATKPNLRAAALAKLELPPPKREVAELERILATGIVMSDGWRLNCTLVGGTSWWPMGENITLPGSFALREDKIINLKTFDTTVELLSEKVDLKPYQGIDTRLLAGVKRGNTWQGLEEPQDKAGRKIRVTVADSRPEEGYMRWIIESVEHPNIFTVYEGKLLSKAPEMFGWPVQLKQVVNVERVPDAYRQGLFDTGVFAGEQRTLQMYVGEGNELRGVVASSVVKLTPGEPILDFTDTRTLWKKAVTPGAVWSGKMTIDRDTPVTIRLTFAEIESDGGYIRFITEYDEHPYSAAVYEGKLDLSDAKINGFALIAEAKHRTSPPKKDQGGGGAGVMHTMSDTLHLRLTPDGKNLVGTNSQGDLLNLAADSPVTLPLDTESAGKAWLSRIVSGTKMTGKVFAIRDDKSAEVMLDLQRVSPDGQVIEAQITGLKPKLPAVRYKGSLLLDRTHVNGFCLRLLKEKEGTGPSLVLGGATSVVMEFRISHSGDKIYGRAGYSGEHPTFNETLEFRAPTSRTVATPAAIPVPQK